MKNIKTYTLENCTQCYELKVMLLSNGISYTGYNVSEDSKLGDKIEDLLKCYLYPIVSIGNIWLVPESEIDSNDIITYSDFEDLINLINKYK